MSRVKHAGADTAAGGAAYGAFLGGGNAVARANDRINAPKYQANRKANDKKVKAVKRQLGLRSDIPIRNWTKGQKNSFFANYPKDVPGGKVKRVQAHIWGANKYGKVGPAAGVAAAGVVGAELYQHHRQSMRKSYAPWEGINAKVSKSMPDSSSLHIMGSNGKRRGKLTKVTYRTR